MLTEREKPPTSLAESISDYGTKPMIPLAWDHKELQKFRQDVERRKVPIHEMRRIVSGDATIIGDRPSHVLNLPVAFRLVYSVEEHPRKDNNGTVWIRHMSMSLGVPGKVPSIPAIEMISKELGFPPLKECFVEMEGTAVCLMAEFED